MEKYRLVGEKKKNDTTFPDSKTLEQQHGAQGQLKRSGDNQGGESEDGSEVVKITQQGKPRNYITYAMNLFAQGYDEICLKAMGRAINKAVTIAEILKRKMPLHQVTALQSCEIIDVFEPLEEGLDVVESKRCVSCMTITLSKTGEGIDFDGIGYQPPLPVEEIQPGDMNTQTAVIGPA